MNRREMLTNTGRAAAAGAILAAAAPHAFAGEDDTIQIALVGCGGRGTGAAANALSVQNGSIKLVAMADVFADRLEPSHKTLTTQFPDRCDVPKDRQFLGFDAYKSAMDCLKPGDVVILTTPPAFRWVMFSYAIEKGLNVFMEKPVTVDGPSTRKILALNEKAQEKNLKVGVGLMCRHCEIRGELFNRIQDGEIGDVLFLQAYRMLGPVASAFSKRKPDDMDELEYQIRRFHSFLWASGGAYSDFLIHNIDECCWMKDAWPVEAKGSGGRHYRDDYIDQNFDTYSVEYTFEDGTKLFLNGRNMVGCHNEFASYAHGSKGSAIISASSHSPARSRIFEGHKFDRSKIKWQGPRREPNPYQLEWNNLIAAIRENKTYNEVERGAKASLVTSMGRMAAHTGTVVTFDEMLNCEHEFAPTVDQLSMNSPAPVQAGPDGTYPVPMPGLETKREY